MAASLHRKESSFENIELTDFDSSNLEGRRSSAGVSSLQDIFPSSHRRDRAKSLENIKTREILRHYNVTHEGSVRGTFIHSVEIPLYSKVWKKINQTKVKTRDYSLFIFHKNNVVRRRVKRIVKSRPFQVLMGIVVLLHSLALCFYQPAVKGDNQNHNSIIRYVTVLVTLLYLVEAGLNIVAFGLIQTSRAYLKSAAHFLDVCVIIFGILYIALAPSIVGEIFAALMALKLLKILSISANLRLSLNALAKSFYPLFYLSLLTFIVITFFALIGIQILRGKLHGGCFAEFTTPAGNTKRILVSEFPCFNGNRTGSHVCPYGTKCMEWDEGPKRGIISFDNIGLAYLTVFQVISLEGWTNILYLYESALGYEWVWLYFVVVIFLGSIFILNMWTGVLTSVFIGVSDREKRHKVIRDEKEDKLVKKDLENYNIWLRMAAEINAPSDTESIIDRRHSLLMFTGSNDLDFFHEANDSQCEEDSERDETERSGRCFVARSRFHSLRRKVRRLVKNKYFLWSVLVIRAVNLVFLMTLHYPPPELFDEIFYGINYLFSALYLVEFLVRISSLSKREYVLLISLPNKRHLSYPPLHLEIILSLLTVIELVIFLPFEQLRGLHLSVIINALWCLKLIACFKYTRSWQGMKEILGTMFQLLPSVFSLMLLVIVFLFVFTILGVRLFGGRLSNSGHLEPNFDDLFFSFLLVFQLMTSEDWNNVLFTSLDYWIDVYSIGIGGLLAIYFVIGVGFGSFILLSVFIAMSVDKLSEVRQLKADSAEKRGESEKEESKNRQRNLTEAHVSSRESLQSAQDYGYPERGTLRLKGASLERAPDEKGPLESLSFDDKTSMDSTTRRSDMVSETRPKFFNPFKRNQPVKRSLKLTMLPSNIEDEQEQQNPVSSNTMSPKSRLSSFELNPRNLESKLSLDFPRQIHAAPYERAQSSPADVPLNPMGETTSTFFMPKLDTLEEVDSKTDIDESVVRSNRATRARLQLLRQKPVVESSPRLTHPLLTKQDSTDNYLTSPVNRSWLPDQISDASCDDQRTPCVPRGNFKQKVLHVWKWFKAYVGTIQLDPEKELAAIPAHSSFFILSPDNRFREFCYRLVRSKSFQTVTFIAVLLSSIVLAVEVPIGVPKGVEQNTDPTLCNLQNVVIYLDIVFVLYFLIEMILKMIALGLILHRGSYLRGFFNILDFIIAVSNVVPIIAYYTNGDMDQSMNVTRCIAYSYSDNLNIVVRILRVLRVLRPLRAIRIRGLYLVVTGLLSTVKSMGSIFFMILLVLIIFAVSGVQFFRGQFYYCTDATITLEHECNGSYFVYDYTFSGPSNVPGLSCPRVESRRWLWQPLNFDNFGTSILTLFSMLTLEGWPNVMYNGVNSNLMIPKGPIPGNPNHVYSAIFFIIYMVVMALILIALFTGFVIVTFQEVGVKSFREIKLDRNQRNCLHFALSAKPLRQYIPRYDFFRRFHTTMLPVVNHTLSKAVVASALIINCILLAAVSYKQHDTNEVLNYLNLGFTVFFFFEAAVKITVLTPPIYFRSIENVFECLIVVATLLEFVVQLALSHEMTLYSQVASSFRVLRLLAFIPQVRLILWTVVKSLEIFPWVGYLLVIFFFIYAVIGMQFFGDIKINKIDSLSTDSTEITEYNNFANFPQALLVIVRMSTGEDWQNIMLSCIDGQLCEQEQKNGSDCGNSVAAYIFFPSFFFFSSIMILNLFVAIIIDNFDYIMRDKSILGAHLLDLFVKLWSVHDPEAKGKLPPATVLNFLRGCNPPVGWGKLCPDLLAYKKMMCLNMPIVDGEVTFTATLLALVRSSLEIHCKGCGHCTSKCNTEMKKILTKVFPGIPHKKIDEALANENDVTVGMEYGALLIQTMWRNYVLKRRKIREFFHGEKERVLKAGTELRTRRSDFELELPSMPIPESYPDERSDTSEPNSCGSAIAFLFPVDVEPTSTPVQPSPHSPPAQIGISEPIPPAPVGIGEQQAMESESVSGDLQPSPHAGDNLSELSFASAYSQQVAESEASLNYARERMETTV